MHQLLAVGKKYILFDCTEKPCMLMVMEINFSGHLNIFHFLLFKVRFKCMYGIMYVHEREK